MSLLSSWYEMDFPVELLAYDLWAAENDKTGLLNVGVDSFGKKHIKDDQYPWPWCQLVLKQKNTVNEDNWESWTNEKMRFFW